MEIQKTRIEKSRLAEVDFENLGFGEVFSDHMFVADYSQGEWKSPRIIPFQPIQLSPGNCALHYGQIIFEGLKAFPTAEGEANIFRPYSHHERLNRSAQRLCIPSVGVDLFMCGLRKLIDTDRNWIPRKRGCALYIRPFIYASDNFLGVKISEGYRLIIITSPVGDYYKEGINPISLVTSNGFVRSMKGGLGEAKTPANYAASLLPAENAKRDGYTQVLWLDTSKRHNIEEVGTMNIMFVIDDEIVTPPLEGSILPGVTRDSIIRLAKKWEIPVRERLISINEVLRAAREGRLKEAFGTGTAAVISPIGTIRHKKQTITISNGQTGPLAQRFYNEITAIQYGEKPDQFGWCRRV